MIPSKLLRPILLASQMSRLQVVDNLRTQPQFFKLFPANQGFFKELKGHKIRNYLFFKYSISTIQKRFFFHPWHDELQRKDLLLFPSKEKIICYLEKDPRLTTLKFFNKNAIPKIAETFGDQEMDPFEIKSELVSTMNKVRKCSDVPFKKYACKNIEQILKDCAMKKTLTQSLMDTLKEP